MTVSAFLFLQTREVFVRDLGVFVSTLLQWLLFARKMISIRLGGLVKQAGQYTCKAYVPFVTFA